MSWDSMSYKKCMDYYNVAYITTCCKGKPYGVEIHFLLQVYKGGILIKISLHKFDMCLYSLNYTHDYVVNIYFKYHLPISIGIWNFGSA
jgi:hypothetical protein